MANTPLCERLPHPMGVFRSAGQYSGMNLKKKKKNKKKGRKGFRTVNGITAAPTANYPVENWDGDGIPASSSPNPILLSAWPMASFKPSFSRSIHVEVQDIRNPNVVLQDEQAAKRVQKQNLMLFDVPGQEARRGQSCLWPFLVSLRVLCGIFQHRSLRLA